MDIQILNIAELLLFVFMICTCIRIYRQKKQKGKNTNEFENFFSSKNFKIFVEKKNEKKMFEFLSFDLLLNIVHVRFHH